MDGTSVTTSEGNKRGRPCKYESHVQPRLSEILEWLKHGMNEYSICEQLKISRQSWIEYKEDYIELANILTRARTERNCLVMNSMFGKAVGIKETVKKAFKVKEVLYDENGKKCSEIERLEYGDETIYVPPDVNAADLYLRNNDDTYKSAKAVEIGSTTINNFQLEDWESKRKQILADIIKLETQTAVDVDAILVDDDGT